MAITPASSAVAGTHYLMLDQGSRLGLTSPLTSIVQQPLPWPGGETGMNPIASLLVLLLLLNMRITKHSKMSCRLHTNKWDALLRALDDIFPKALHNQYEMKQKHANNKVVKIHRTNVLGILMKFRACAQKRKHRLKESRSKWPNLQPGPRDTPELPNCPKSFGPPPPLL